MIPTPVSVGTKLTPELTVLGIVQGGEDDPVYLVWSHSRWCPLACKVLSSSAQAQHEAGILGALEHPAIVRSFGLGGPCHLLMEYVEGPSLAAVLQSSPEGRMDEDDALRTVIHVGAALHHMHQRSIIHLDVKPSNIVVAKGRPVLCDVGLARRQRAETPKAVLGTRPYIAPECCRREDISPAADVFGLGVTLFELLTGKLPFFEGTDENPYPQVNTAPVALEKYRIGSPPRLQDLILSCLSTEPERRPLLPALLIELHGFIQTGPRMWPSEFSPSDTSKSE